MRDAAIRADVVEGVDKTACEEHAQSRFAVARGKYGFFGETNQSAAYARFTTFAATGVKPSPNSLAFAVPMVLPWFSRIGNRDGTIRERPGGRGNPSSVPGRRPPSVIRARISVGFLAAVLRTACVLPKNAASPQKSCCFQVGTTG